MEDSESDTNDDGMVDYVEGVTRVQEDGGYFANLGNPQIQGDWERIPTLSEWKQIFLTLLMLSLVMGFTRSRSSKFVFPGSHGVLGITGANLFTFDRNLFFTIMKYVGLAVVIGLAGATAIFGHVSMLNITGTLFCAPLVAYILHLVLLFKLDAPDMYEQQGCWSAGRHPD